MRRTTAHRHAMRSHLAIWAGASLALHAVFLLLFQFAGERGAAPPAEPEPIRLVELEPASAGPEPPAPREIPEPDRREVPQQPPEPEAPDAPAPEPELPDAPSDRSEAADPAPEPAPDTPARSAPPQQRGAQVIAPEAAEGAAIPELVYRGEADAPLSRFGRAVECAGINDRYDAACADIGPIYLAGDPGPLAPEIVEEWRERDAAMAQAVRMRNSADRQAVVPCGLTVCLPPPERFEARGQGVRKGLRELNLIE